LSVRAIALRNAGLTPWISSQVAKTSELFQHSLRRIPEQLSGVFQIDDMADNCLQIARSGVAMAFGFGGLRDDDSFVFDRQPYPGRPRMARRLPR
jgi:hypothetical protein